MGEKLGAGRRQERLMATVLFGAALALIISAQQLSGRDAAAYAVGAGLMALLAILLLAERLTPRATMTTALVIGLLLFSRRLALVSVDDAQDLAQLEYLAFRGLILLSGAAFISVGPRLGLAVSVAALVTALAVLVTGPLDDADSLDAALRLAVYSGLGILMFQLLSVTLAQARATAETASEEAELAYLDDLTGLPNRRQMSINLNASLTRAVEGGGPDAVVLFDLDHFKMINDTYGHDVGDEVLIRTARLVQDAMRERDVLGRWGGEEFLVLLEGASAADALQVAHRCRRLLATDPDEPQVTASFGVATILAGDTLTDLLRRADLALYEAKQSGRNRVVFGEDPYIVADGNGT